jgi:sn-glycerol 3-phosphate transport system ATP-binding protein
MNLLEGRAEGTTFRVGEQNFELPQPAPRNGAVILGLRPEHAELGDAGGWALKVDVVETLGAERLIYCKLGASLFTLRIDATQAAPRPGTTLHLKVRADRLHWFDSETRARV